MLLIKKILKASQGARNTLACGLCIWDPCSGITFTYSSELHSVRNQSERWH